MKQNLLFNLSKLNKNDIDFYHFTLENINLLIFSTVQDIAKKYGCGISFIYSFFDKLNVSGLKEYIYKLGYYEGFEKKIISNRQDLDIWNKKNNKIEHKNLKKHLMFNYLVDNEINFDLLEKESKLIEQLCKDIKNTKKIYGFGIGHAEICIKELFGMFNHFGLKTHQFLKVDDKRVKEFLEINSDDLFILYTFRGIHKYTEVLLKSLKEQIPNLTIYLVTANPETKFLQYATHTLLINNNTRNTNYLKKPLLVSAANPFLLFNDYLKNYYFLNNIEELKEKSNLIEELEGWRIKQN